MSTIRPCSESVRHIFRPSAFTQFRVGKGFDFFTLRSLRMIPTLHLRPDSCSLSNQTRSYNGPRVTLQYQQKLSNTAMPSLVDHGRSLSTTPTRVVYVHTATSGSKLDFALVPTVFPDSSLWYVLTAITLTAVGRQHLVGPLWEYLSSSQAILEDWQHVREEDIFQGRIKLSTQMEEQVVGLEQVAVRLRDGLMKMSVLLGYPRAINALSTLYKSQQQLAASSGPTALLNAVVLSRLNGAPPTRPYLHPGRADTNQSKDNNFSRGLALFTKIYSPKHVPTILHNMSVSSAGDLSNFAVSRVYGDLLSDVSILDERETGLACFVTCLGLALGAGPEEHDLAGQIKGHMYGARNLGASGKEVRAAAQMVIDMWETVTGSSFEDAGDPVKSVLEKQKEWA